MIIDATNIDFLIGDVDNTDIVAGNAAISTTVNKGVEALLDVSLGDGVCDAGRVDNASVAVSTNGDIIGDRGDD